MNIRYYEKRPGAWHLDFWVEGKRKRPFGGTSEADARANTPRILAVHLQEALTGTPAALVAPNNPSTGTIPIGGAPKSVGASGPTLGVAFRHTMKHREKWLQSKDRKTLEQTFEAICTGSGAGINADTPLALMTRDTVRSMRAHWMEQPGKKKGTKLSASTVNHRLSMLSALLEEYDLAPHMVKHLSVQNNGRTRRILEAEVLAVRAWMLQHAHRKGALEMADLITLGIELGARVGELHGLAQGDIHGDVVTFRDTKNGSSRMVPLTPAAKAVLEARKDIKEGPFAELSESQRYNLWNEAREELGFGSDDEFVFHSLRHEAASRMADAGVNAMVMKSRLGHKSVTTTDRYTHASLEAQRMAAEMVAENQALMRAREEAQARGQLQ